MSEHRLIYADELYETLANKLTWLMKYGNCVYLKAGRDIKEAISEQPITYDIDEVVEEVKHLIAFEFNWLKISIFEKEYIDLTKIDVAERALRTKVVKLIKAGDQE